MFKSVPRALYVTLEDRGRVFRILKNWPERNVQLVRWLVVWRASGLFLHMFRAFSICQNPNSTEPSTKLAEPSQTLLTPRSIRGLRLLSPNWVCSSLFWAGFSAVAVGSSPSNPAGYVWLGHGPWATCPKQRFPLYLGSPVSKTCLEAAKPVFRFYIRSCNSQCFVRAIANANKTETGLICKTSN